MESFRQTASQNWADFKVFLYNKETKEVAGRTGKSWAEIGVFYLVFYLLLAGWWAFHLFVATSLLPEVEDGPKYTDYLSHRGPGLHVVPQADVIGADKQRVYFYNDKEEYLETIDSFIQDHNTTDKDSWGECSKANVKDSWDSYKPCFYFYLNAVHNFVPEPMEEGKGVNVECKPAKAKYEKYFKKAVVYPEAGFDLSHFPWKYGMDWRNEAPLVVVQIELDQENFNKDGLEARIVCSVQAANVHLDIEKPNIGSVDFRIRK